MKNTNTNNRYSKSYQEKAKKLYNDSIAAYHFRKARGDKSKKAALEDAILMLKELGYTDTALVNKIFIDCGWREV